MIHSTCVGSCVHCLRTMPKLFLNLTSNRTHLLGSEGTLWKERCYDSPFRASFQHQGNSTAVVGSSNLYLPAIPTMHLWPDTYQAYSVIVPSVNPELAASIVLRFTHNGQHLRQCQIFLTVLRKQMFCFIILKYICEMSFDIVTKLDHQSELINTWNETLSSRTVPYLRCSLSPYTKLQKAGNQQLHIKRKVSICSLERLKKIK